MAARLDWMLAIAALYFQSHSWLYFQALLRHRIGVMKTSIILAISSVLIGFSTPLYAGTSTYQVTGPVLEVTDSKIVIQKETEKWEIARSSETKVTGELKVGSKVTVHYTMTATTVEVKPNKPASAPATPEKKPK
jgi:hypothetical protein